jgi:biopolymer transport protein ExbD
MRPVAPPSTRSAIVAAPNVTPMIDVMLVLLIIFMVTIPAIVAATEPPEARYHLPRPEIADEHTLVIDALGRYHLGGTAVTPAALGPGIARLVAMHPEDRVLIVKADASLDYGVVQGAVDIARASGIIVIGFVTKPRAGRP